MRIVLQKRLWVMMMVAVLALGGILPYAAAAEQVVSIEFEDDSPVHLYVDHNTAQLKALAVIQGSATKKDVTSSAFWATTDSSIVKVDKGKLTPVGQGSAKVSAKYEGFTVAVDVTVDYLYAAVRLNVDGPVDYELQDDPLTLTAEAVETDGTAFDVTKEAAWSTSNPSVAEVSEGKVQLLKKGTVTITVTYKGRTDSVQMNATSPYESLTIEHDGNTDEFLIGQTGVQLEAVAKLTGGLVENVSEKAVWTSSNPSVVTVEDGKLIFKSQGTADIQASRFGHTAKVSVIVRLPYQALLLTPSDAVHLFATDNPIQLTAEVANDFTSRTNVTGAVEWKTSDPLVVTADRGLLRPRGPGMATVTAAYRGLQKQIDVIVMPVVNGFQLDETNIVMFKNEVVALPDVAGTDLNGTEYSFADLAEWSSGNEAIVAVEKGKLKAKGIGRTTVTMRIRGETATIDVEVREKVLALTPSASSYALVKGEQAALPSVKALLEDGTELDVTNAITWETSSPNLLLAGSTMKALLTSKVTLTGTYLNKKISIPVTIEDKLSNLTVDPLVIELNPKRSKSIKVTGVNEAGKTVTISRDVKWTSANPSVATVSGSTVRAVAEGRTQLQASFQGATLRVEVAVVPKLQKLVLSEKSVHVKPGSSANLKLIAYYDNGKTVDVTNQATWTSSNVSIAEAAAGKVIGLKKGSVSVKAAFMNKSATVRVSVNP